jgi:hypothetical protein
MLNQRGTETGLLEGYDRSPGQKGTLAENWGTGNREPGTGNREWNVEWNEESQVDHEIAGHLVFKRFRVAHGHKLGSCDRDPRGRSCQKVMLFV